jgi:REP element-mobilizing transposase RayT
MPRTKRALSETGIYHALVRGINQQSIFEDAEDNQIYLTLLKEVKDKTGFELFSFCLMGNHAHLLLKENEEPLSQVFRCLGVRYVRWFNDKYQRSGHLFQDRFKSQPVQSDAYFISVIRYIHNNPVKAGICDEPESYEWSSLRLLKDLDPLIDWAALKRIMPLKDMYPIVDDQASDDHLEVYQVKKTSCSDRVAREILRHISGAESVADFQRIDKGMQRDAIPNLKSAGLSVRQIARITGLSKGCAERWGKQ